MARNSAGYEQARNPLMNLWESRATMAHATPLSSIPLRMDWGGSASHHFPADDGRLAAIFAAQPSRTFAQTRVTPEHLNQLETYAVELQQCLELTVIRALHRQLEVVHDKGEKLEDADIKGKLPGESAAQVLSKRFGAVPGLIEHFKSDWKVRANELTPAALNEWMNKQQHLPSEPWPCAGLAFEMAYFAPTEALLHVAEVRPNTSRPSFSDADNQTLLVESARGGRSAVLLQWQSPPRYPIELQQQEGEVPMQGLYRLRSSVCTSPCPRRYCHVV